MKERGGCWVKVGWAREDGGAELKFKGWPIPLMPPPPPAPPPGLKFVEREGVAMPIVGPEDTGPPGAGDVPKLKEEAAGEAVGAPPRDRLRPVVCWGCEAMEDKPPPPPPPLKLNNDGAVAAGVAAVKESCGAALTVVPVRPLVPPPKEKPVEEAGGAPVPTAPAKENGEEVPRVPGCCWPRLVGFMAKPEKGLFGVP